MVRISDAELEVMEIIWERGRATSFEIIKELNSSKWNDNTIRTLINRLAGKKAIGIAEKNGKTYTYVPLIEREKYVKYFAKEFVRKMYNGNTKEFIIAVMESDEQYYREICKFIKEM